MMRRFSPLASCSRPTTLLSGAAFFHPPLALLLSEKTGGFASTVTKKTTPLDIVGIHSLMRAAV